MKAPFSSKDMDTFVSPIRGAAVAMPFTIARSAFAVREERLSMVARGFRSRTLQKERTGYKKRTSRASKAGLIRVGEFPMVRGFAVSLAAGMGEKNTKLYQLRASNSSSLAQPANSLRSDED